MANTKLNRTAGSTGNVQIWTWSGWVKRAAVPGTADAKGGLFATYTDGNQRLDFGIDANHRFFFKEKQSSSTNIDFTSNRLFEDPSAFYHFVLAVDTTDSTAADRVKVYVNGERITSWLDSTPPNQNYNTLMNVSGRTYYIGTTDGSSNYWNGVMSHVHFCDGTALAPTVFGSTDTTTGEWKINTSPSFTPGTNGFTILKDGNTITDQSSNSNDFTLGGGTLTNTEDNPSNNFATLNPLDNPYVGQKPTLTNGNTTGAGTETGFLAGASSIGVSSGKYYAEFKVTGGNTSFHVFGVLKSPVGDLGSTAPHDSTRFYGVRGVGTKIQPGGGGGETASWTGTWTTNDIISLALDCDNNRLYIAKNGQYADGAGAYNQAFTASPAYLTLASDEIYHLMGASISTGSGVSLTMQANFGNGYFGTTAISSEGTNASGIGKFEYDVPANFTALSTKGLNE